MRYVVKLFAGLVELVGESTVAVESERPLTGTELKSRLMADFADAAPNIDRALLAVNQQYSDGDGALSETDEIALIPPVGGGRPEDDTPSCMLSSEPLDVAAAYQLLENTRHGGTVLFCGTVREWTAGRQTSHLEYEAYQEMALRQMKQIEDEVKAAHPDVETLQWHRIGHLLPTDIAVICAAASPHRDAAFSAARMLIERLKKEVPIWKKEFFADGNDVWQQNRP